MKVCEWTERVAVFAGGDSVPGVERHVEQCAECRTLLTELLEDREAMGLAPEVPESAYEAVRAGVMSEVRQRRRPWVWVAVAAAAVLVVAAWFGIAVQRPVERLEVAVRHPEVVLVPVPLAREEVRVRPRVRKGPAEERVELATALQEFLGVTNMAPARSDAPVLITALTEDPDVVIVLVPETKGDFND